jgi:hypothetical protein
MPIAIMPTPARRRTGVSLPGPVDASKGEPLPVLPVVEGVPLPVFPVDEGLLTTATGDVVVVVAPTLEDGIDVVDVVVDVDEVVADVVGDVGEVVVVVVVMAARITTLKPSTPWPVTCPGVSPSKVYRREPL